MEISAVPLALAFALGATLVGVATRVTTPKADHVRGRDASPNYNLVFAQDRVARLDLHIGSSDWEALLHDVEQLLGPVGQGLTREPGGLQSQEAVVACHGSLEGGACSYGTPSERGRCALTPDGGPLACFAMDVIDQRLGPGRERDDLELLPRNPIYIPADVTFEGETFRNVGFRLNGNSTLVSTWLVHGSEKLPFRLNFDAIPETRDSTFFGFSDLAFSNGAMDSSYVRAKVVTGLFRAAGLPAPRIAFMRVFLDRGFGPIYLGLYTMEEIPGRPMLNLHFGSDTGNLYKPHGRGGRWMEFIKDNFPNTTNEADGDWTDIAKAIAALNARRDNLARWRFDLEAHFDVQSFLRWLALNTIVGNSDAYGRAADNYYLYESPLHSDRLFWIPWDPALALRGGLGGGWSLADGSDAAFDVFHDRVGTDWPLIRFLMDDPVYRAAYREHLNELLNTVLQPSRVRASISFEHALVARYVIGEDKEDPRRGFAGPAQRFEATVDGPGGLLAFVEDRAAAVRWALEHTR